MPCDASNPNTLLFVYGTLRQGCSNHQLLLSARYLGQASSRRRFSLYVDDYPYVVQNGQTSPIQGEVYQVDQETWRKVDILEGHPDWYYREREEIQLASGEVVWAWMYFFPEPKGSLVPSGDFLQG